MKRFYPIARFELALQDSQSYVLTINTKSEVPLAGIEPAYMRLQLTILPLNYKGFFVLDFKLIFLLQE